VIGNKNSIIHGTIASSYTDPEMVQPHNHQGSFDDDFLVHILEELIEQPDNSLQVPVVMSRLVKLACNYQLPIGGSTIASSSQPVPCTDSRDTTIITNNTSIENEG